MGWHLLNEIKSFYEAVSASVKLNGELNWNFEIGVGETRM